MEIWMNIVLPIISGLVATIPLVIKLVDVAQKSAKAKNWKTVIQLVLALMKEAEQNYTDGAEKKQHVLSSIKTMESTLEYDIDEQAISELIDAIVAATKKINTNK